MALILFAGSMLIFATALLRSAGWLPLRGGESSEKPPAKQSELKGELSMEVQPKPLYRDVFDAQQTMLKYWPVMHHVNKQAVLQIACPPELPARGEIAVSRWPEMGLPTERNNTRTVTVEVRADYFTYDTPAAGDVEWHLNFADPNLFFAYGTALFAQDEIQVAEHPALGSILEMLNAKRIPCSPVEHDRPRPVLIAGVERRCRIKLDINASEGRPNGLYGNHFSRASVQAVERATQRLNPPTISNILALAAPPPHHGAYTAAQIELILATAYSGFRAAVLESRQLAPKSKVVLHTGYWGCGAFGGNRELMALLQLEAARLAGVDRFVFHAGDAAGVAQFQGAQAKHAGMKESNTTAVVDALAAAGYRWGASDGN